MTRGLVFVESNTTGTGRLFIASTRAAGLTPVLLTADPSRYRFAADDALVVRTVDTADAHALEEECRRLSRELRIAGITSSSEYYAVTAARLAGSLDLPHPDVEAVEQCRDKAQQIRTLAAAGVAVPEFRVVQSPADAVELARELGLPVVLKPIDGSGSVGVRLCESFAEVAEHARSLAGRTRNERGLPTDRRMLLERFVDGPEYSIEVFDGKTVGITRKHLGPPPYFVETGHDFPAELPTAVADELVALAERAVSTLGVAWGATHVEARLGAGGATLVEVNPRLAGGCIPVLVQLATGVDLIRATLDSVIGASPSLSPTSHAHTSIRFVMSREGGTIAGFDGLDEARAEPRVVEVVTYVGPGTRVTVRGDFRDRVGHVIASAESPIDTRAAVERAHARVVLRMAEAREDEGEHERAGGTGRIKEPIAEAIREVVFAEGGSGERVAELELLTQVDRAHVVMLACRGLVDPAKMARVLSTTEALRQSGFAPLLGRPAPRGLYLLYEGWLIEQTGAETGGLVHLGRSRNDLNATLFRLRLRSHWSRLVRAVLRLQATLARRALRHLDVVMPVYTHYQAAVPSTYGHYLAALATGLARDLAGLFAAAADLGACPLGAGAVGGTTLPIDTSLTARLLGFDEPALNSIDAVASRDLALRVLAAAAVLGVTLSRLANDLLLWSTAEFDLLWFPDRVIGSSSMMPQKRNPFPLEHVQGKSAAAAGAFMHAAMAMHATPFTNSIAVGTEALRPVWSALDDVRDSCVLARIMVENAVPNAEAMARRAELSRCTATEAANRLTHGGQSFRQAHHAVGSSLGRADAISPAEVVLAAAFGGGPAPESVRRCIDVLREGWWQRARELRRRESGWQAAQVELAAEVDQLCREAPTEAP